MLGSVGQDVGCLGGFQPVGWGLRTASGAFSSSCEQITARRMAVGSIRSSAKRGRHVSKALAQIAAVSRHSAAASTSSAASASGMLACRLEADSQRHNLGPTSATDALSSAAEQVRASVTVHMTPPKTQRATLEQPPAMVCPTGSATSLGPAPFTHRSHIFLLSDHPWRGRFSCRHAPG